MAKVTLTIEDADGGGLHVALEAPAGGALRPGGAAQDLPALTPAERVALELYNCVMGQVAPVTHVPGGLVIHATDGPDPLAGGTAP